jgi:D-alanine-D-alanine ligase
MLLRTGKNNRCEVAMLVDAETGEHQKSGRFVPDRGSMEEKVFAALRARYATVSVVPFGPDIVATLSRLKALNPRMVFNLTEWFDGDRTCDHAIASLLDMMKFRFTGTGQAGMQLCRDKALSKQVVAAAGVDVPKCFTLHRDDRVENRGLAYPLFVKPQYGDGSDGISKNSLVNTPLEFCRQIKSLRARFPGAVVCEEYIPGRDIYVGIIGNEPRVLAPTEMVIDSRKAAAPKFATYRLKNDGAYRTKWRVKYRLAALPRRTMGILKGYSARAFHALKLRDYARLDFRLTDEGRLAFIEANPNPDLTPHTLGHNLCFVGIEHSALIPRIVETARRRYQCLRVEQ